MTHLWMRHIRLLVPQPHRPNKALIFDRPPREPGPHKRRLRDHALPRLLLRLLSRLDHREHFLLAHTLDLWNRDREPRRLLIALLLDGRRQRFRVLLVAAVQQVLRQGFGGGLGGLGRLDVALLVAADLLLHLDLLLAALLRVKFGAQAPVVLRFLGRVVALAGDALADALIVVEALAMSGERLEWRRRKVVKMCCDVLLLPALDYDVVSIELYI
jgi:hypothetical protein